MNISFEKPQETVANIERFYNEELDRIITNLQDSQHCYYLQYSLCRNALSDENNNNRFMLIGLCHLYGY
jgi:hypothetical protein